MTDGERVYAYFGNVGVFAFDMDGTPVWSHPIGPFPSRTGWGTAASPVLHDRRLYIVCDNEEQSFLVAFDARTGKQIWRVERDEKSSWSTPHIWQHDGKTEIVTNASSRIRSYDLDGKLLWELGGASSIAIPTPVSRFGMVYISSGYVQDEVRPGLRRSGPEEPSRGRFRKAGRTTPHRSFTAITTTPCSTAGS